VAFEASDGINDNCARHRFFPTRRNG
jgi:hypothetical protein